MPTLLVIDDEPSILLLLPPRLRATAEVTLLTAATAAEGLALVAPDTAPTWSSSTCSLPDAPGLDVVPPAPRSSTPASPVIFITGHGTTETAIEAMKQGAFDYLLKPLDLDRAAASWSTAPSRSAG